MAKSIGYVPQHIYLSDDTVAANIAFGVKSKLINYKAIEKASKIANLHEFVLNDLPNQYQTTIGERGVRLWKLDNVKNWDQELYTQSTSFNFR